MSAGSIQDSTPEYKLIIIQSKDIKTKKGKYKERVFLFHPIHDFIHMQMCILTGHMFLSRIHKRRNSSQIISKCQFHHFCYSIQLVVSPNTPPTDRLTSLTRTQTLPEVHALVLPQFVDDANGLQGKHVLPQVVSRLEDEVDRVASLVSVLEDDLQRRLLAVEEAELL